MFFNKNKEVTLQEDEEIVYIDEDNEEYVKKPSKPSKLSIILNKYFHHLDRGGSLHGEIIAGISVFFLAICMLFVNMQVISASINGNITLDTSLSDANVANSMTYATIYMGSLLIAFVGSILMGLVARLPFVQISTMALGTNLICMVSAATGLTYYNMLFINFIASIFYVVIVALPMVHNFLKKGLPSGVRKALPVALGLILTVTCLSMSGLINANPLTINPQAEGNFATITYYGISEFNSSSSIQTQALISSLIALVAYGLFKGLKSKRPALYAFIFGTLLFFVMNLASNGLNPSSDTAKPDALLNFGRVWAIAGSSKLIDTPFADSYLTYAPKAFSQVFANFGLVFTKGADFSAYTGSIFALILMGVLTYLFLGLYDAEGTLSASEDLLNKKASEEFKLNFDDRKDSKFALITNAATNVIAPFFGVGSVTLSKTSLAGQEDSGKSGIVPLVASIGFLISMFIMAFPALFATKTYIVGSMNEWNYYAYGNGGFILVTSSLGFAIADIVMAGVGISMLKNMKKVDFKDRLEFIPFIITVIASFLLTNIVLGVAIGTLSYFVMKFLDFRKVEGEGFFLSAKNNFVTNVKTISIPIYVLTGIMFVIVVISLI